MRTTTGGLARRPLRSFPLLLCLLLALPAGAQEAPTDSASGPLTVAVYEAPPFAERTDDGTWDGLGVELAQEVGQKLGRGVRFVEAPADSGLAAVASGRADLALAPMTAAGEAAADYTAPFYAARLGVTRPMTSRLATIATSFFSGLFFKIAAGLAVLLLIVGVAVWALERHANTDDFREDARGGIWDGFWWAGVTMTTIGYGDKSPQTVPGKTLALLWMLVSMGVTASLTAALVSALGLQKAGSGVRLPEDLQGDRVGVVDGSAAAAVLREARVDVRPYPSVEAGLQAVHDDSLDTFVDAAPRLRAAQSTTSSLQIQTTGVEFERWAFAVPTGSPLREAASRAVLDRIHSADWPSTVNRYIGSDS